MQCSLCGSETILYSEIRDRIYYSCVECKGILLHPSCFLPREAEKERYQLHQNDVTDSGYQKFVFPITQSILKEYSKHHKGLDFGSGTNSATSYVLKKNEYDVALYDPFFNKNTNTLAVQYDYIICCEVMEHFYNPAKEFQLLDSVLKPKGNLYCKTKLYNPKIDFNSWWYKNDATHVFFYSSKTLMWIKNKFNFNFLSYSDDLIVFKK